LQKHSHCLINRVRMIMPIALLISPRMRQATENFQTQVCLRPFNSGFRLFHIGKLKKPSARYVRKPDNVACASLRRVYLSLRVARCLVGTHTHTHTHAREQRAEGKRGKRACLREFALGVVKKKKKVFTAQRLRNICTIRSDG
jgi:hypothetical protein